MPVNAKLHNKKAKINNILCSDQEQNKNERRMLHEILIS